MDIRGSARRGTDFEGALKHIFGQTNAEDQRTGTEWLVREGLTDASRVGLYGSATNQERDLAMWERDSMELPHFTKELAKRCQERSVETVFDLVELEDDDRRDLLQMPDSELLDIARFCNRFPNIDMAWEYIGAFHIGDNPGRKEPTTGEINYLNIFRHIHSKGYDGVLCMEHGRSKPGKEGEAAVIEAYRKVDAF